MEQTHFQTINTYRTAGFSFVKNYLIKLRTTANIITCKCENQAPSGSEINPKLHRTVRNPERARS